MPATPETKHAVIEAVRNSTPEWPYSADHDTVTGDPWPVAWDAAAFIEEWFDHPEHSDVEEAICHVPLSPDNVGYDVTDWHYREPPEPLLRAHLLRIVKGWSGETALKDYLDDNSELVGDLGFTDRTPSKTTLWRVWNQERLSDDHKQVVRTIGQVLVNVAREQGIAAPDEVFHPDPSVDAPEAVAQDDATVRDRTIKKTREVWQQAKPLITENYTLDRGENAEVHENAFWESHAYIGSRAEMYAENGTWNFAAETTRKRVHTGSTHRHHLQQIGPDEAREMHRSTTADLIERAQKDGELTDGVIASIDITKSNPYRTNRKLERDDSGNVTNPWLLGYKDEDEDQSADFYFQWASIQITGLDVPVFLDAIPVSRGLSRAAIVDELLEKATEMIDIEMLLMDREFAIDAVKDVCEQHDVWYLTPGTMRVSERAKCTRLRQQGKLIHIERDTPSEQAGRTTLSDFTQTDEEQGDGDDGPVRKQLYLPAMNTAVTGDEPDDEEIDDSSTGSEDENGVRNALLREFADVTDEDVESVGSMFDEIIEEIEEEEAEQESVGSDEDVSLYILFETNHPDIEIPDGDVDAMEKVHMVSRVVRLYEHRWTIENGFKQVKSFRVRTTSMKYEYRFFNFLYACSLYNVWRLVDTLVKLELDAEIEFRYKPLVTADLFLTIAKEYQIVGLDPPD